MDQMNEKGSLSLEAANSIVALYPFGQCLECTPFTAGTVQSNYLIKTTARVCVLRHYTGERSLSSIRFEINLLRYLHKYGFPCPAPLKNRQGEFIGTFDAKPYVIFEYMSGQYVENPTEVQKQQVIEKAALLHHLTRGYRPSGRQARLNYSVESCRQMAEQEAQKRGTPAAKDKLEWLCQKLARLQLPISLPKGVCHADLFFTNILFEGDSLSALLDFDDANYTFLLYDLVWLISAYAWPYPTLELDFAEARRTIHAYDAHRPLTPTEKRHLFDVFKLSILIDCVWYFGRGEGNDFYEKQKIDFLEAVGRECFYHELFGRE